MLKVSNLKRKQGNGSQVGNTSTKSVNPSDFAIDKSSTAIKAQARKRRKISASHCDVLLEVALVNHLMMPLLN